VVHQFSRESEEKKLAARANRRRRRSENLPRARKSSIAVAESSSQRRSRNREKEDLPVKNNAKTVATPKKSGSKSPRTRPKTLSQGLGGLFSQSKKRPSTVLTSVPSVESRPRRKRRSSRANPEVNSTPKTVSKPIKASSPPSKPIQKRKRKKQAFSPFVYVVRLLILGIGLGAIAGTVLSAIDPAAYVLLEENINQPSEVQASPNPTLAPLSLLLREEVTSLKEDIQALAVDKTQLQPGLLFVDLDTGAYVGVESATPFAAASTIKIPILIAFFEDVDAGKVKLDEKLVMTEELVADGSGNMQYSKPGTEYTALDTATRMIMISDNTATNMIMERLGGAEVLNQRFRTWGLAETQISNLLPDLEGTNTTSPRDLVNLMAAVSRGDVLSLRSRDWVIDIMKRTVTDTLLPRGLGEGATIAHKTGDIGSMVGDAGVIDMPNGKRYLAAVMVKRPHNDPQAQELIRNISKQVYQYFEKFPSGEVATPESSPTVTEDGDS